MDFLNLGPYCSICVKYVVFRCYLLLLHGVLIHQRSGCMSTGMLDYQHICLSCLQLLLPQQRHGILISTSSLLMVDSSQMDLVFPSPTNPSGSAVPRTNHISVYCKVNFLIYLFVFNSWCNKSRCPVLQYAITIAI